MTHMQRKTYSSNSVGVANAILKRCFKRKIPVTFKQLERATLRVEQLCMTNAGEHAINDYVYPAITDKISTVDQTALVTKYIPRATGPKTAVRPPWGSTLHRAIKQTVAEHHAATSTH